MTITNTYISPVVVEIDLDVTITGMKTWEDDGREHDNAAEVQLVLSRSVAGGEEEVVTDVEPTWWNSRYYFADMPRFDEEGRAYHYTVAELPVEGYATFYDGFGNYYTYTVGEQMVAGYWLRVEGYDLYNTLLIEEEPGVFGSFGLLALAACIMLNRKSRKA